MRSVLLTAFLLAWAVATAGKRADPLTILFDTDFRDDVQFLYDLLYSTPGMAQIHFNTALESMKSEFPEAFFNSEIQKSLEIVISDIATIQKNIKILNQNLKLMDTYEDEGGVPTKLEKVRAQSQEIDRNILSELKYMDRPRREQIEELNQKLSQKEMTAKDNELILTSMGFHSDQLQQLRDRAAENNIPNDSGRFSELGSEFGSRRRVLSWRQLGSLIDSNNTIDVERKDRSPRPDSPSGSDTSSLNIWAGIGPWGKWRKSLGSNSQKSQGSDDEDTEWPSRHGILKGDHRGHSSRRSVNQVGNADQHDY